MENKRVKKLEMYIINRGYMRRQKKIEFFLICDGVCWRMANKMRNNPDRLKEDI